VRVASEFAAARVNHTIERELASLHAGQGVPT
jgi:hypothetical protein